jgi:hypothetical protein
MDGNLGTTNLMLGIMAAVSVLEALVVIGLAVAGFMVYRRVTKLVDDLERRQVAPAMARVNAILDDVKEVSGKVRGEAERVDHAVRATMNRVDDTKDRVRSNVRSTTRRIVGVLRGVRVALEAMLNGQSRAA